MKIEYSIKTYLFLLLFVALILRIGFSTVAWINPDEGSHLMDGRLVLDGYIPMRDYEARQPIYVYLIALVLKIFGTSYKIGRFIPILSSIGVGAVLYFIGKKLFSPMIGLLASVLYLFTPSALIWSTIVKTEQIAMLLFCSSVLFMLNSYDNSQFKWRWMLFSGGCAALSYYVRGSAILLPSIIAVYILLKHGLVFRERMKGLLYFCIGYVIICLVLTAFFIHILSFKEILLSPLIPFSKIRYHVLHILGQLPFSERVANSDGFRIFTQGTDFTLEAWRQAIFFSLPIICAAFGTTLAVIYRCYKQKRVLVQDKYLLLFIWFGFLLFLYLYQTFLRGFFAHYIVEFYPPLVVLAAVSYSKLLDRMKNISMKMLLIVIGGCYFLLLAQKVLWKYYAGIGPWLVLSMFLIYLVSLHGWRRLWLAVIMAFTTACLYYGLMWFNIDQVIVVILIFISAYLVHKWINSFLYHRKLPHPGGLLSLVAIIVTMTYSGFTMGPQYVGVWSPDAVQKITRILKVDTHLDDEVLSGSMIWTFEAGLTPYLHVPHSTQFLMQPFSEFEKNFQERKPAFIVVDGYTEKKFIRFWDFIVKQIKNHYLLVAEVKDIKYTIKVYKLSEISNYRK